jgi:hypothetical protein
MMWKNCCWRQSGGLIDVSTLPRAEFRHVDRFSSQPDTHEKATIIVDELKKAKDE